MNFTNLDIAQLAMYVDIDGMEPEDAAALWLSDNCARWTGWASADQSNCPDAPAASVVDSGSMGGLVLNSSPDDGITDEVIKVGWIGDLTGPTASAQAFNAHGSAAYFECSNADGGLLGRQWEFFAEDDGYNAEKSAIALTKLIEDEEVLALVDLGGSGQATQAIPELESSGVPVIGPPQTVDPTLGSGQFFHNIAAYGDQADIAVGMMANRLGDASKAVVLGIVLEVPSGTEYATYVQDSVIAAGGTYVGTEYVGLRVQEATAQIIKLEKAIEQYGVNFVALHGAPYHNELVLKAMSAAGLTDIPVVGIHGVATNSIFNNSPEDVTDDTYGVHSFKTSVSDAAGASELKRCADLAGYPGEDLVNNFSHGFLNSYILHQAIVKAATANGGDVTRVSLTAALADKFDTMGLSCEIDWTTSNHSPCGAPFTMDRATGGMVQAGPFSDYSGFLDGVYGIDPVVFQGYLAGFEAMTYDELVAAANEDGELFLYGDAVPAQLEAMVGGFMEAYPGIEVEYVRGTPVDLVARISAEHDADATVADVMLSTNHVFVHDNLGSIFTAVDEDLVPVFGDYPEAFKRPYTGSGASLAVPWGICVNTDLVDEADFPTSFADLADPKWKDEILVADFSIADVYVGHWDALAGYYGDDVVKAIAANFGRTFASGVPATEAVAAGEGSVELVCVEGLANFVKKNGAPVELIVPDVTSAFEQRPTLLSNGPHPYAGRLFVNYALSNEGINAWMQGENDINPWMPDAMPAELIPVAGDFLDRKDHILDLIGMGE
jgi:iron(III) transport system substrate-binding protein